MFEPFEITPNTAAVIVRMPVKGITDEKGALTDISAQLVGILTERWNRAGAGGIPPMVIFARNDGPVHLDRCDPEMMATYGWQPIPPPEPTEETHV